jgi:glycosyltransferase involved in cell wall biosynthesis
MTGGISVVVPTLGRPSLAVLLHALASTDAVPATPIELILVDDRPPGAPTLPVPPALAAVTRILPGRRAGPAAARNVGWRAAAYPWVAFLDDDVLPAPGWLARLAEDLEAPRYVVGVQGTVEVPLPADRLPTDWERVTLGLAQGRWITADMAYRREALATVGGFDERFPRAFREDADLAWRMRAAGGALAVGTRRVAHPVRPESPWVSVRTQAGNADDALLRRLYGSSWRRLLGVPEGRRHRHAVVTAAGLVAVGAALLRRRTLAAVAAAVWLGGTTEFAAARIAPGPGTPAEVARMLVTSAVIPPLAVAHWLRGWWRHRAAKPWPAETFSPRRAPTAVR